LRRGGAVIGGIGVSGGGDQDQVVATVGAAVVN
jgi:uncharacterized protein GlcG (DUF336 family)